MNNRRGLVRVLVRGGIIVRIISTGYTLGSKINSKTAWVCKTNLVKRVRYKASDYIEFRRGKEFLYFLVLV